MPESPPIIIFELRTFTNEAFVDQTLIYQTKLVCNVCENNVQRVSATSNDTRYAIKQTNKLIIFIDSEGRVEITSTTIDRFCNTSFKSLVSAANHYAIKAREFIDDVERILVYSRSSMSIDIPVENRAQEIVQDEYD